MRWRSRWLPSLLRREGLQINHKRVCQIYREDGLTVRRKRCKRLAHGPPRERLVRSTELNEGWSMDFVSDALESELAVRVLTVVDECSRQ